jgi:hypothetical protein
LLAAVLALTGAAACGDNNPFLSPATRENAVQRYSVWALSGTNPALPASIQFTTLTVERPQLLPTGSLNFEVAFDLTADGKVRFIPARALVPQPPAGAPTVGLQRSSSAFEAVTRAPDRGFVDDTALVAGVNEVVLVRLGNAGCFLGDPYFAKAVVDSVILSERRVVLRALVNRNCGYRSLTEGLPST